MTNVANNAEFEIKCNQLSRLKIVVIYFLKSVLYNQAETGILYVDV